MDVLPEELYRPEQVAALDRRAIDTCGVPGALLMERAGVAAYRVLRERWPDRRAPCVLCGGGNNGGDGYVIAELARRDDLDVEVLYLSDPERLQGDAAAMAARYRAMGGRWRAFQGELPAQADVIVDAMLGTGLQRPVEGRYRDAVECVNASGLPVLAVDIPSGLQGATGAVLGVAVRADLTPTFIGLKAGLFTGQGPACAGTVRFADLNVPPETYEGVAPFARRVDYSGLRHWFAPRPRDAHKGRFGHALVVGGDHGTGGAVLMAARAAARSGAGLVSVVTRGAHVPGCLAACPELMVHEPDNLESLLDRADVVIAGPGLGMHAWGRDLLARMRGFGGPMVLDADALNQLAETPEHNDLRVLTPHPGEAARLLGWTTGAVQADRFQAAEALCQGFGGVAVLKGAGTVIHASGSLPSVCTDGNPGMASGGMGDVLSGLVGGFLAQGMEPRDAAVAGVCVHAAAGDRAAAAGERGMLATDLLDPVRTLVNPQ